ncbi:protein Aster-B-like isoform X2 [Arctopsyche grandis]|uniref:protein Aster-B-like isoform X2 n=1 Tax=Arctopsyche grandis TaxID=121162 RepID=UPI00406D8F3A
MAAPAHHVRKSVENIVISSHDAIGQSISHALSFSGAITQQASQHVSPEHKSVSRSPSPCRRSTGNVSKDSGDSSVHSGEGDTVRLRRTPGESSLTSLISSPQSSLSVSTPLPEQPSLLPLNRSASQECQPRNANQSVTSLSVTNLVNIGQSKPQESRTKKKSWYNALYPTYKSRSEDFKRIFKDVPDDERLIVDYSCAVQKDILVHGRLYVSQKYLSFYANIFRWETILSLQWKDVSSITKEKTALVIPNAILVCTDKEKHFFTSFSGRDKAYMMLFTIWQNALMDKAISSQEMWQLVHSCYGEQLGFDSDDEEFPQVVIEEDKLSGIQLSADSVSEVEFRDQSVLHSNVSASNDHSPNPFSTNLPPGTLAASVPAHWARPTNGGFNGGGDTLPTDMSDTTDSEADKPMSHATQCTDPHDGRKMMFQEINLHIDQLFTMLFTNSKFYVELLAARKTTDLVQGAWKHDTETGLKCRTVNFTLLLGQAVGPKTTQVTETQVMLACTRPGHLYSIDVTSCNAGVPYADSFTVGVHYCLQRVSENVTSLQVFGSVKYKKSVWGIVKTFIEKNCWQGLEDYFECFSKALHAEVEDERGPLKRKSRRRRRLPGLPRESELGNITASPMHRPLQSRKSLTGNSLHGGLPIASSIVSSSRPTWLVLIVLCILIIINGALYWRLWRLEGGSQGFFDNIADSLHGNIMSNTDSKSPSPELINEWSKLLKDQSSFHVEELDRWRKALNDAITLLKQTEAALANLQLVVKPSLENSRSLPQTDL